MVKYLKFPIDEGIKPMRLLANKSRKLRYLNNPISWGIEPESSFLKMYKVVSEGKMSFQFCAPKEKNEIEEEDENFFLDFWRKR